MNIKCLSDSWFSASMDRYRKKYPHAQPGEHLNKIYAEVAQACRAIKGVAKSIGQNRADLSEDHFSQIARNSLSDTEYGKMALLALSDIENQWDI